MKWLWKVLLLVAVLALAITLRIDHLGHKDLGIDEVLHVYAAQSLDSGKGPVLPGGVPYTRALGFTRLVALSGHLFGLDEWSARVPSVLFGVLVVLLLYLIGAFWYSPAVGLTAALLASIVPSHLVFSGTVRMYTLFHVLYLLLLFLVFEGVEAPQRVALQRPAWLRGVRLRPSFLVLAALFLALAWHIHALIAPALMGSVVYIAARAWTTRRVEAERKKYRILLALLVLGVVVARLLQPNLWGVLVEDAFEVPLWAEVQSADRSFYLRELGARYPWPFWLCAAIGAVSGLRKRRLITTYLLLALAVPLGLHSLVFAWKAFRYVSHLTFILYILCGLGLAAVADAVRRAVKKTGRPKWAHSRPVAVSAAVWLGGLGVIFAVSGWPSEAAEWRRAKATHFDGVWYNSWSAAMGHVSRNAGPDDFVVTSRPLLAKYYGPVRPLFLFNRLLPAAENRQFSSIATELRSLDELQSLIQTRKSGWFVCERTVFDSRASIPEDVRRYLIENWDREYVPEAPDMVVMRRTGDGERPGSFTVRLAPVSSPRHYWKNLLGEKYPWSFRRRFDYRDARVVIEYPYLHREVFSLRLAAEGLKPDFCYQVKLEGKPSALWEFGSDDRANEALGRAGRWWRNAPTSGGSSDSEFEQHKNDEDYVFSGFVLMDFLVTDSVGRASVDLRADSSYLFVRRTAERKRRPDDGPLRNVEIGDATLQIYAQRQEGRAVPGALSLPEGTYEVQLSLTEETFDDPDGTHAKVMVADEIRFRILADRAAGAETGEPLR